MATNHAQVIRDQGNQSCAYCHQPVYCARCHAEPVLPVTSPVTQPGHEGRRRGRARGPAVPALAGRLSSVAAAPGPGADPRPGALRGARSVRPTATRSGRA